jgi:D-alanyl-D-alanine carboxypeptidase
MNTYVRAYGMERTSFADSSGLSPRNLSTAYDLTLFAKHLYDEKEYLLSMAGEDHLTITSTEGRDWRVTNQNKLADDPYFRGGKLGYTDEAMQTSLAIFNVPVGGETRPVAVIVLGSQDWKQDTRTLLRWLTSSES